MTRSPAQGGQPAAWKRRFVFDPPLPESRYGVGGDLCLACRAPMGETGAQPEGSSRRPFLTWNETEIRLGLALFFLYLFLVGIKSLEKGISSLGSALVFQVLLIVIHFQFQFLLGI